MLVGFLKSIDTINHNYRTRVPAARISFVEDYGPPESGDAMGNPQSKSE